MRGCPRGPSVADRIGAAQRGMAFAPLARGAPRRRVARAAAVGNPAGRSALRCSPDSAATLAPVLPGR